MNPAACYSLPMPLDQDTLAKRLAAARTVVGFDQSEMGAELEKEGLGKTDAMRLERGKIEFSNSHWAAYVRITRMPEAWFTAPDYSALFIEEAKPPKPLRPDQVLETIGSTSQDGDAETEAGDPTADLEEDLEEPWRDDEAPPEQQTG